MLSKIRARESGPVSHLCSVDNCKFYFKNQKKYGFKISKKPDLRRFWKQIVYLTLIGKGKFCLWKFRHLVQIRVGCQVQIHTSFKKNQSYESLSNARRKQVQQDWMLDNRRTCTFVTKILVHMTSNLPIFYSFDHWKIFSSPNVEYDKLLLFRNNQCRTRATF